jgi:hypothetical protein
VKRSRVPLALPIWLIAVAACTYAGLFVYKGHRFASAYAMTRIGDSQWVVKDRFGEPPNVEFLHSSYFPGYTSLPCALPCAVRLWWQDPASVFTSPAFYFEFDEDRRLVGKTHYEHLDEAYVKWRERLRHIHLPAWDSTEAEQFREAKVVALVRLLKSPQVDPRDSSWGALSKFLVVRSWKGPFSAGATIIAATSAYCGPFPHCETIFKQPGQLAVIVSGGDEQPIYPITKHIVGAANLTKAVVDLDALAAQAGT